MENVFVQKSTSWSASFCTGSQLSSSISILEIPFVFLMSGLFPVKSHYFPFPGFTPTYWWSTSSSSFWKGKMRGEYFEPLYVWTCYFTLTLDCYFGRVWVLSSWVASIPNFEHICYIPVLLLWSLKMSSPLAFRVTVGSQIKPFFIFCIRGQFFQAYSILLVPMFCSQ